MVYSEITFQFNSKGHLHVFCRYPFVMIKVTFKNIFLFFEFLDFLEGRGSVVHQLIQRVSAFDPNIVSRVLQQFQTE